MPCKHVKADGKRCRAPESLVDTLSGLCPAHSPGAREKMSEIGRKGAAAAARRFKRLGLVAEDLPPLRTPEDAEAWLETVGRAVATGRLGHHEGAAVTRAVKEWLHARAEGRVSDRMKRLEEALQALKGGKLRALP